MNVDQVIECTIGLFDDSQVPRGQVPPTLAAAIISALWDAGYIVARHQPHSAPCCVARPLSGWPASSETPHAKGPDRP